MEETHVKCLHGINTSCYYSELKRLLKKKKNRPYGHPAVNEQKNLFDVIVLSHQWLKLCPSYKMAH